MSYIENNLLSNERVIVRGKLHKWIFLQPIVLFCAVLLGLAVSVVVALAQLATVVTVIAVIAAIILGLMSLGGPFAVIGGFMAYIGNEVAVTDRRVIGKFGVIRRETLEFPFKQIESIALEQDLVDRLLGGASIQIRGSGAAWVRTPMLANFKEFRSAALEQMEGGRPAAEPAIAAVPHASVS